MSKSMNRSGVPWADYDWPVLRGCSQASEGCNACYAKAWHNRFARHMGLPAWGAPHYLPENLDMPRHTRKPGRVFVAPMSDVFHEGVTFEQRVQIFHVIANCPQHTFIVLTKRPQNIPGFVRGLNDWPLPNVWLGVTAENQDRADERIPILLSIPAAVRFVSAEPMLGSIELYAYLLGEPSPDWCIAGPENGRGKRPFLPEWIASPCAGYGVADQCWLYSVPFFDKRSPGTPGFTRREFPHA